MADGTALVLARAGRGSPENKRGLKANCQAPNPEVALSSIAHGILQIGDPILVVSGKDLPGGMEDRYRITRVSPYDSLSTDIVTLIKQFCPKMVVLSTKLNLTATQWSDVAAEVQNTDAVLVVDNAGDLDNLLTHEIENPMKVDGVHMILTSTSDVGGTDRGAIVLWDAKAVEKTVAGRSTLNGGPKFALFPGTLGGPDIVNMAAQTVALNLAISMRTPPLSD